MDDPLVEARWDIEADLMEDSPALSSERKKELQSIFRTVEGKPSFSMLCWLVEIHGYFTKENYEEWKRQFDAHIERVDGWLAGVPDFPSKDWSSWMYHMELYVLENVDLPKLDPSEDPEHGAHPEWLRYTYEMDEPTSWTKYASQWRRLPTEEQAAELHKHLCLVEYKIKYDVLSTTRKLSPKNPVEFAYAEGLMDANANNDVRNLRHHMKRCAQKQKEEHAVIVQKMDQYVASAKARQSMGGRKRAEEFQRKYEKVRELIYSYLWENPADSFTHALEVCVEDSNLVSESAAKNNIKKADVIDDKLAQRMRSAR